MGIYKEVVQICYMPKTLMKTQGQLFVVGLPIGHIEDITLRAFRILKEVDIVVAEDTRSFKKLLKSMHQKIDIFNNFASLNAHQKIMSYHQHNEAQMTLKILKYLKSGKTVVLVSEAGTPCISDPGHKLISQCYQHHIPIRPIPGVSALTTALSLSPFESGPHYFIGFPPKKATQRDKLFQMLKDQPYQIIAFESPHRLKEHLKSAQKYFINRHICIQRELTKPFEEIHVFALHDLPLDFLEKKHKGEFVIIYSMPYQQKLQKAETVEYIQELITQNKTSKDIAKHLSKQSILSRSEIYRLTEDIKSHKK